MDKICCDILVVGAGPAGLAAGVELLWSKAGNVLLMDMGESLDNRKCPRMIIGKCFLCRNCSVLSGVGGASGLLGGKLCLFPAGSRLTEHTNYLDSIANGKVISFLQSVGINLSEWSKNNDIRKVGIEEIGILRYKNYDAFPLLKREMRFIFNFLVRAFVNHGGIIKPQSKAQEILINPKGRGFIMKYECYGEQGTINVNNSIVIATGRSGAECTSRMLKHIGVRHIPDLVDFGVRLEVPSSDISILDPTLNDPKLILNHGKPDEVRTLCWCRGGELCETRYRNVSLVDGHFNAEIGPMTSVSIVARERVPQGYKPFDYAVSQFYNSQTGKYIFQQSIKEFISDVSWHGKMGKGRFIGVPLKLKLLNMIEDLDNLLCKGLLRSRKGHIYGPVIDNFWGKPILDIDLMTGVEGIYIAGDSTGLGRGIIQGLFSGIIIATAIKRKMDCTVGSEKEDFKYAEAII